MKLPAVAIVTAFALGIACGLSPGTCIAAVLTDLLQFFFVAPLLPC
jgi:hypothetical protein